MDFMRNLGTDKPGDGDLMKLGKPAPTQALDWVLAPDLRCDHELVPKVADSEFVPESRSGDTYIQSAGRTQGIAKYSMQFGVSEPGLKTALDDPGERRLMATAMKHLASERTFGSSESECHRMLICKEKKVDELENGIFCKAESVI
ncbi:hypothetical protein EDB85DRAFT_1895559 [Lactarius pseudohatsudake]|nr:hypothetical protein EDB85DRAFT_1895559 [Lactarius pseudohatsudake]